MQCTIDSNSKSLSETKERKVKILNELPVLKPVTGHFSLVPFLITSEMFGGLDFEMVGKNISSMIGESLADLHVHQYPEIYLLISQEPGEAEIEIETTEGSYKMSSPSTAYIPANVKHRFVVHKAAPGSFCFGILLNNKVKAQETGLSASL